MPRSILIWDLPVRLFHWLLAGGFAAAAIIALTLGEHSRFFPYHMMIGLTLALMVLLRIVWGIVGTRHARFSAFAFGPGSVLAYLRGVATGKGPRHIGHNPASAWAIFAMLALILALAATGIGMSLGYEAAEEIHEPLAWATIAVIAAHVLGVIVHTIRHREPITLAMIDGRKDADPAMAIPGARPIVGVVFLAAVGWWAFSLVSAYDAAAGTTRIPLIGTTLALGESEGGEQGGRGAEREHERGGHDDDDDDN